jgi:TonB family protein
MHLRIVLAAIVFSSLGVSAWAQVPASAPLHTFYGEVKAIDLAAKTITIKTHVRSFVFHITDETKISSPNGHISWEKVQRGQGATVVMRLGEGGVGIAVAIRFNADASFTKHLALYSARTVQGEMISGVAVNNFVAYQPPDIGFVRGLDLGPDKKRMFRLAVRPDGTVESATPYVSFGVEELDARAVKWLKKWRFRPNSVTEVRMPMGFYTARR